MTMEIGDGFERYLGGKINRTLWWRAGRSNTRMAWKLIAHATS